jgi:hypothetical protein
VSNLPEALATFFSPFFIYQSGAISIFIPALSARYAVYLDKIKAYMF